MKIIIMIGPPGSGKGTQAKKIAGKYDLRHLSSGDLLRALAKKENLGAEEKRALDLVRSGNLVPDTLIFKLIFPEILTNLEKKSGVALDGAVRTLEQAKEFQKFFKEKKIENLATAVEIKLSDRESFERLTKRRMCKACGEIVPWLPETKKITVCPKCGGELETRHDDNPAIIKERIAKQGNKALKPITDYYKKLGILRVINGSQSIEKVFEDIVKELDI